VDTLGLLVEVVVHSAGIQDRDGAKLIFERVKGKLSRMKKIWVDGAYAGELEELAKKSFRWVLEVIKRDTEAKGFILLPQRWVVERTFGWLNKFRRLSKDYEYLLESSETMIRIAMIRIMLKRLVHRALPP